MSGLQEISAARATIMSLFLDLATLAGINRKLGNCNVP